MLKVGDKVICVDDSNDPVMKKGLYLHMPVKGRTYTVSQVGLTHLYDPMDLPCIHVEELDRVGPIWAHRFRLLPNPTLEERVAVLENKVNDLQTLSRGR